MAVDTKDNSKGKDGMKEPTNKALKQTTDPKIWQDRFDLAYRNQKRMFRKWAEWYELMYAIKTYKNIGQWRSKGFIPIMSYKAWTIIAKLLAMRPGFSPKIYDKLYSTADREKLEKAKLKLEYDYDNPMLDESIRDRLFDTGTDAVVVGTGFGKADWCTETRENFSHYNKKDGTIDHTKANIEEYEYGYNDLEPINPFDVFAQPGGRSFEKKEWIIIKFHKSRAKLLTTGVYDEGAVKDLRVIGKNRDEVTRLKESRNKLIGDTTGTGNQDTLDDTIDGFDIYECYEKKGQRVYLCTFAEAARDSSAEGTQDKTDTRSNWVKIRAEKQPYWHCKYPLMPCYIRRRPHDAWGESIFEITEGMANSYNDIFNQFADNLNIVGNGGILMHGTDPVIYDFFYGPGGEIRYSGTKPEFETPKPPDMGLFRSEEHTSELQSQSN